jgi:hypothetical protein
VAVKEFTLEFISEVIIYSFDVTAKLPGSFCSKLLSVKEKDFHVA